MNITTSDHWLDTKRGKVFVRAWAPSGRRRDTEATIILFHDSLGCVELWRDFPVRLAVATCRSVIAYDRLGFGRSDAHPGRLPMSFIRDEAATIIPRLREQLGLESMIPLGHSVGGAMAVVTAASWPAACATLITESAQTFVEDLTLASIRAAKVSFQQPGEVERLERYHGSKARWVLDAWIGTWLAPEFAGWNLEHDLQHVRCPTLAIHGDSDEYGSSHHAERIARVTQGWSRAVILEACGHVPHREQPERVLSGGGAILGARGRGLDTRRCTNRS